MSLIKEFTSSKKELLTDCNRPYLAGWRGDIYKAEDGRVFALLQRDQQPEIVGLVPARYATYAENLEYNPYDSASYARETIELAESALRSSEYWQLPLKKTKSGNCPLIAEPDFD